MENMVLFFKTSAEFRDWLSRNYKSSSEQWVGFYKKGSNKPSISWSESVDQALCFGWIDGLRKSIDHESYKIRFTPRKQDSHWSKVNIAKMAELKKLNLVKPEGLAVFDKRRSDRSGMTAYEQDGKIVLAPKYQKTLEQNSNAWEDFKSRAPSYQKQCIYWIMSAKKEETRNRRLQTLIDSCDQGQKIPPLRWQK